MVPLPAVLSQSGDVPSLPSVPDWWTGFLFNNGNPHRVLNKGWEIHYFFGQASNLIMETLIGSGPELKAGRFTLYFLMCSARWSFFGEKQPQMASFFALCSLACTEPMGRMFWQHSQNQRQWNHLALITPLPFFPPSTINAALPIFLLLGFGSLSQAVSPKGTEITKSSRAGSWGCAREVGGSCWGSSGWLRLCHTCGPGWVAELLEHSNKAQRTQLSTPQSFLGKNASGSARKPGVFAQIVGDWDVPPQFVPCREPSPHLCFIPCTHPGHRVAVGVFWCSPDI